MKNTQKVHNLVAARSLLSEVKNVNKNFYFAENSELLRLRVETSSEKFLEEFPINEH